MKRNFSAAQVLAAAAAMALSASEFIKKFGIQVVSRGKGNGAPGKNVMRPYPTDWKTKLNGKTFGKRQQERMARQIAAGWHKPHPMAVKLASERDHRPT